MLRRGVSVGFCDVLSLECGGCMLQSLFAAFHVSWKRFSQTSVLSDTCTVLNECSDHEYVSMHDALRRKHGKDRNVADTCSNHCPLHSMYLESGLAKPQCYPTYGQYWMNVQTMNMLPCMMPCIVSMGKDRHVADTCSNHCSLHSMYLEIGSAKRKCYPTHAHYLMNVQPMYMFACMMCRVL